MKILLFENEFDQIRSCFDAIRVLHFKDLTTTVHLKSQDIGDFKNVFEHDFVFIDINLTSASELDGFQILAKLLESGFPKQKICILTGWLNINEELISKGFEDINSLTKPVKIDSLMELLKNL